MDRATRRQLVGMAGLAGVALASAVAFSLETVVAELEGIAERPFLFVFALVALYIVRPFLLWPVSSIALVLGYLYGMIVAFPLALAGAGLTAIPPYLVGRYASTDAGLFGYVRSSGTELISAVGETRGVVAARLSPVPGDPISYAAGLSGVSPRSFLVGTVVGEIPWAAVAVATGASMRQLTLAGFSLSLEFMIVVLGLAAIALAGPLYNHVVGTGGSGGPSQDGRH